MLISNVFSIDKSNFENGEILLEFVLLDIDALYIYHISKYNKVKSGPCSSPLVFFKFD